MENIKYMQINDAVQVIQTVYPSTYPGADGFIEMCDSCCDSLGMLHYIWHTACEQAKIESYMFCK